MALGSTQQEAIRQAIALALSLPDVEVEGMDDVHLVEWESRASAHRPPDQTTGVWVDLDLDGLKTDGKGEFRYDRTTNADPALNTLVPRYCVQAEYTVAVKIGIDNQEPDAEAVLAKAGNLRTRMRFDGVREVLRAGGVVAIEVGQVFKTDFKDLDGRQVSRSRTDIRFRSVIEVVDDTTSGGIILRAEGSGETGSDLEGSDFDSDLAV